MNTKVMLGMSGGVDSSVAAYLLMQEGYEVQGCTALFTRDESAYQAAKDAAEVAAILGIPHTTINAQDLFEQNVIDYFVKSYECGETPSPCVMCNKCCKIPTLIQAADEAGCDWVATGHYAHVVTTETGELCIEAAADTNKDQSYMLSQLSANQLSRLIFPLADLEKTTIRSIAADAGLPCAQKAESQDICFIAGKYEDFLDERNIAAKPGDILSSDNRVLGRHQGLHRYTIGQRKGIGIAAPKPLYVIGKDVERNAVIVGYKEESRIRAVYVDTLHTVLADARSSIYRAQVKLRYRSSSAQAWIIPASCWSEEQARECMRLAGLEGLADTPHAPQGALIILDEPQDSTAPGQYAVVYRDKQVIGGGAITSVY